MVCCAVVPLAKARKNSLSAAARFTANLSIRMKQYSANTADANAGVVRQGIISEWDLNTGQFKSELCVDPCPVHIHSTDYNHNGTLLVTAGADGMVRLFDIQSSDCLVGWHAHSTEILDVTFNSTETSIYSIATDGKVSFFVCFIITVYSTGSPSNLHYISMHGRTEKWNIVDQNIHSDRY